MIINDTPAKNDNKNLFACRAAKTTFILYYLRRMKKIHKQKKNVFKENWNFSINCLFSVIVYKSTT